MTIKELEIRTGMTRANIRFYEGEGLLAPKRLSNGYRDYSEEDTRTLEKIKLLRQLQLDIDTIRKVQQGALTLEQALFTQLTRLEGDRAVIQRAAEVCRELHRTCVEYAALDPQIWLRQLEEPERPRLTQPPSARERERLREPRACRHPWMRLFARGLDMTLYDTVINVVWLLISRDQSFLRLQTANVLTRWLWGLLILSLALALEPFWLHYWGWTPGKWVFGLRLRDGEGEKLTLAQGFQRGRTILWDGYGLTIPFYQLWRFWKCREICLEGRDCHWDGEYGYRYTREERRIYPAVPFVVVSAMCVAALFLSLKYTETPPNRGPLTVEQFAENYNYYYKQLIDPSSTALKLGEDGRWVEQEPAPGAVEIYLFGDTTVWEEPQFTLDGGRVTAVTLHMESSDSLVSSGTREFLALLAMSGSADGLNLFNFDIKGWAETADETLTRWADAELDYRGLHISQQVEDTGYDVLDSSQGILHGPSEREDVPHHCEKTVTISLME